MKAKYARRKARREERQIDATAATVENDWAVSWMNDKSSPVLAPWEQELVQGMQDGSVPSAVSDSGTTSGVGKAGDPLNATGKPSNKTFRMPTGTLSNARELMHLKHNLRYPARDMHLVEDVTLASLISNGKFADAGYATLYDDRRAAIFDLTKTKISASTKPVLKGWRTCDGLYRIPLEPTAVEQAKLAATKATGACANLKPPPKSEAVSNVFELRTQPEIVRYYHAAAGFPTKATWLKAIKNNQYSSWPGLTPEIVDKHVPESEETQKGHMKKQKAGIRSTSKQLIEPEDDGLQPPQPRQKKLKDIMVKVINTNDELAMKIYIDQTGRFPKTSVKGNQYIMVLCEIDSSGILVEPLRNKSAGEMTRAFQFLIDRLRKRGIFPKHLVLDNEISKEYRETMEYNKITYQLVPPHDHRRNIAERAIQTFKGHFISIMCGTPENFPLALWCRLLPQAELTLNLLRPARQAPNVSAYAYLFGEFNYDAHPLAPLGTAVEMHVVPEIRETFGPHSASGFYIGASLEHYRCHRVWIKDTRAERVGNTVFFKHKYLTMPTITNADALLIAAKSMESALEKGTTQTLQTTEAVKKLMKIFQQNAIASKEMEAVGESQRVSAKKALEARKKQEAKQQDAEANKENLEPQFEIVPTSAPAPAPFSVPVISQDDDFTQQDGPATNTRARKTTRTLQDEAMCELSAAMIVIDTAGPVHKATPLQTALITSTDISGAAMEVTAQRAASRKYPMQFLCDLANAVLDGDTGEMLEYRHLITRPKYKEIWGEAYGKEVGRLAQGIPGKVEGTNTIFFIHKHQVPADRRKDVTRDRIVCTVRPEKEDPNRTRICVMGNLINHPGDNGTPTADLLTVKMLLNSVVSTPGAKFMTIDISNFYLNTPLDRPEYIKMKLSNFPEEIAEQYNLKEKETDDGYVYVEVRKGMYGLPQAGILAQELLEKRLNDQGYRQSKLTPGFWKHDWRPICFTLVVDDFGVKYVGKEHAEHLLSIIGKDYTCKPEWEGERYIGLTLDWDYQKREVHTSMPGYVHEAIKRFRWNAPKRPQTQPHQHAKKVYGSRVQYAKQVDDSEPLGKEQKKTAQQIVGTFLYYARAVDSTMLPALSAIASQQSAPTEQTWKKIEQLMDYAFCNPDAIVTYKASNMVLAIHSDASYLSESKARSRAGGHFYLSNNSQFPPNNGAVLNLSTIIDAVMSSAAEAELGALYINAREAVPMRILLEEMGHPQPKTPMQMDNSTALGVVTNTIQPKRTKAMDMRFHWLRDRAARSQFRWIWRPGTLNLADYWTKHHCPAHHKNMRPEFLTDLNILEKLRKRFGKALPIFSASERVC